MAKAAKVYFYCVECPLGGQCTKSSQKKASMFGETLEEAQDAVARHLMVSSYHGMGDVEAMALAQGAEYDTYEAQEEPPPKRQRGDDKGGKGKSKESSKSVADTVAETLRQLSGAGRALMPLESTVPAVAVDTSGPVVHIRSGQLVQAVDCLNRACTAAKSAHRLAASAARAFGDEAAALEASKIALESLLPSS